MSIRFFLFEAMPIKWINQSLRTGRDPPGSETKAIGWLSADI